MMMRVSATTLESFRLWSDPEQEWMSEDDLIATIRGQFVSTPQIELGSAFGQVLETPDRFRVNGGYACRGYTFDAATMAEPLKLMDHRHGVFEAKAAKDYPTLGVTVISKADQLVGARLFEHKTTTGTFDAQKYCDSYQWRFMVDAFEPLMVTYHVFVLDDHGNGVVEVKSIETMNLYPYAGLHEDCKALVDKFVDYVRLRGLDGFLRERARTAAGMEVSA